MARYVSESKLKDVRKLISCTTNFSQGEENFRRCETFALSMLYNHTFLEPHGKDVQQALYGIVEKLVLNAHFQRANMLKEAYEKLLTHDEISTEAVTNTLHFLLAMSSNPATDEPVIVSHVTADDKKETDSFDWGEYLMEGIEIDPAIGQESSDESIWSLEDEAENQDNQSPVYADGAQSCDDEDYLTELANELESLSMRHVDDVGQDENITDNISDSWRASESDYRFTVTPTTQFFPAAKLIDSWVDFTTKIQGIKPHVRILSEYMIVRELLWALRDPTATGLVFQQSENGEFHVASDLSVCSLTPQALQTALSKFCPILNMLYEMQTFVADLIPSAENDENSPPLTYKAYSCGLNVLFTQQNKILLELEKSVMKQDNIATVQSISGKLYEWIKFQTELFSVHKKAVDDWNTQDAWMCASKLLSVLGTAVDQALSLKMAAVFLSLLFCSLHPYLDMIETWLKTGNLQDPSLECLIFDDMPDQLDSTSTGLLEGNYESRPYKDVLLSKGVEPLSLLSTLVTHGEVAGRSIQLLQGLKAMDSIPHPDNDKSLHSELVSLIQSKLLPTESGAEEADHGFQDAEPAEISEYQGMKNSASTLDQYTKDYLVSCNDTYMLKAFGDVLDLGLDITHTEENFELPKGELLFKTGEIGLLQPVTPILSSCLDQLLKCRVEVLGQRAQKLLHERCRLKTHLTALRGVALLEAGIVMHQFFSYITDMILAQDDWHRWASWYLLTNQLQACLSQHQLEWSHLFSIAINEKRCITATSEITEGFPLMQFINNLDLRYTMEWPITLVLRDENMEMYNQIFRFLAKVKCALITLQRLRLQDVKCANENDDTLPRRLSVLRSWLLFLLGSLQEHLLGHILTTLQVQLDAALDEAKDLQSALAAHDLFVRKAHRYCLMSSKAMPAHNMLMEVVALAMSLADGWRRGDLIAQQISSLESDYSKLHTYLTYLFTNLTRFGANVHLAGVASALLDSSPLY